MKIFIVTPFFPYSKVTHAGGRFIYEMIDALSDRHEINLLSRIEPHETEFVREMEECCKNIELFEFRTPSHSNPFRTIMIIISYLRLGIKANRIINKNGFDIVQIEYTETALLLRRKNKTPMILHAIDCITKPAERRYLRTSSPLRRALNYLLFQITRIMELYILKKIDGVFACSNMDRDIIRGLNDGLYVDVLPYPLSCDSYIYNGIQRERNSILFVGAMHRRENIEAVLYFYREIFPFIRREIPEVKFYIVGHNPSNEITGLNRNDENVIVTGFVQDLEAYYLRASVFVSPILVGGGIITKNIDAMSYGLPVVTTSIGNEGVGAVADRDVFVADTPEDFAEKVIKILKDKELGKRLSLSGKRFVREEFSRKKLRDIIEKVYQELYKH